MTGGWNTPSWMGGDPGIGETFVNGKDQPTARGLLDACDRLGVDPQVVRAVGRGFVVPTAVYDEYASASYGI